MCHSFLIFVLLIIRISKIFHDLGIFPRFFPQNIIIGTKNTVTLLLKISRAFSET